MVSGMKFNPHILRRESIFCCVNEDAASKHQGKGEMAESLLKKQILTSEHFFPLPTFTKYIKLIQNGNDFIFKVLITEENLNRVRSFMRLNPGVWRE